MPNRFICYVRWAWIFRFGKRAIFLLAALFRLVSMVPLWDMCVWMFFFSHKKVRYIRMNVTGRWLNITRVHRSFWEIEFHNSKIIYFCIDVAGIVVASAVFVIYRSFFSFACRTIYRRVQLWNVWISTNFFSDSFIFHYPFTCAPAFNEIRSPANHSTQFSHMKFLVLLSH